MLDETPTTTLESRPAPTVRTPRLVLRRWREQDREPFAELNRDSEVMEYLPRLLSRDDSDAFIDRSEAAFDTHGIGLWAVEVADTGRFIGYTGLSRATFEAHFTPAVEVGWRLARSAWGYGYATEAARAALTYAFGTVGLREVVSFTAVNNARSLSVMRRLGMTHDERDDFDHPRLEVGNPLRRSVLYRMSAHRWTAVADFVDRQTAGMSELEARQAIFRAVRDLAYATDAASTAEELIRLRRGNCRAKTDLLAQALRYLGYHVRWVHWPYLLPEEPPEVTLLASREDVHTAAEVRVGDQWHVVDPTLDPPLARLGLPATDWDGETTTRPAFLPCGPLERERHVGLPASSAPQAEQRYLVAFNRWLESARAR